MMIPAQQIMHEHFVSWWRGQGIDYAILRAERLELTYPEIKAVFDLISIELDDGELVRLFTDFVLHSFRKAEAA